MRILSAESSIWCAWWPMCTRMTWEWNGQEAPIPSEYLAQAEEAHAQMIEKLADADEEILAAYLEGDDLSEEALRRRPSVG